MTMALKLLCRVVRRRLEKGEILDNIFMDYPRLTEDEKETVRKTCE